VQFDTTTIAPGRGGRGRAGGPAALPDAGYPRAYRVELSETGAGWREVASGSGTALTTTATFAATMARFVRITQTAAVENAPAWTIQRLRLYEAP
jgi:hypothetical protein